MPADACSAGDLCREHTGVEVETIEANRLLIVLESVRGLAVCLFGSPQTHTGFGAIRLETRCFR